MSRSLPHQTRERAVTADPENDPLSLMDEQGTCPECNGSMFITHLGIDGPRIIGCPYCKGTGRE